jgi:phosphopantothenoylcysteine decarboxylase
MSDSTVPYNTASLSHHNQLAQLQLNNSTSSNAQPHNTQQFHAIKQSLLDDELTQSNENKPKILLGLTGSVASIKIFELLRLLQQFALVRVVTTAKAQYFYDISKLSELVPVFSDAHEFSSNIYTRGSSVLHIELRKWADLMLIAPLSANSLALIATGQCPNLLTCVVRAWNLAEMQQRPIVIAPAMNTAMFLNIFTEKHLATLRELRFTIIEPIEKLLACGDIGTGAMASVETIAETVKAALIDAAKTKSSMKNTIENSNSGTNSVSDSTGSTS